MLHNIIYQPVSRYSGVDSAEAVLWLAVRIGAHGLRAYFPGWTRALVPLTQYAAFGSPHLLICKMQRGHLKFWNGPGSKSLKERIVRHGKLAAPGLFVRGHVRVLVHVRGQGPVWVLAPECACAWTWGCGGAASISWIPTRTNELWMWADLAP